MPTSLRCAEQTKRYDHFAKNRPFPGRHDQGENHRVAIQRARRRTSIKRLANARVGISGWRYEPWRGTFYPKDLVQRRELEFASRRLNSIEINGSFYSLQRPKNYQEWYAQTPADFVFALKGSRYITHMRKLRDIEQPLANFFAQGILCLKEKLGPVLWQFPPQMAFKPELFDAFLAMLPRDTQAAATLAKNHDARLEGRSWTKADANRPIRYAVEIRHPSFETSEFIDLLRRQNVALCFADTAGRWPYAEDLTSDFVYARLHGDAELYVSGYGDAALDRWAARLQAWRAGSEPPDARRIVARAAKKMKARDVYVYFDNDVKVRAPFDAINLAVRLGVALPTQAPLPPLPKKVAGAARNRWPSMGRKRPASI